MTQQTCRAYASLPPLCSCNIFCSGSSALFRAVLSCWVSPSSCTADSTWMRPALGQNPKTAVIGSHAGGRGLSKGSWPPVESLGRLPHTSLSAPATECWRSNSKIHKFGKCSCPHPSSHYLHMQNSSSWKLVITLTVKIWHAAPVTCTAASMADRAGCDRNWGARPED